MTLVESVLPILQEHSLPTNETALEPFFRTSYPIATGVIEGACRHLIKDRMDLTGARWRLKSAEAVLKLRSLRSSNDFEEYWEFHKAEEFRRNHASRYADAPMRIAA